MSSCGLVDRRPFDICVGGHTVCADCAIEFSERSKSAKCPACAADLLPVPTLNKDLLDIIERSVAEKVAEMSIEELELDQKPFVQGEFSRLHYAKWACEEKDVVIKIIEAHSDAEKQKIRGGIDVVDGLRHSNVVRIIGVACVDKTHVGIVMEKAEHGSLDKWIGHIDDDTRLTKLALGIVEGLVYLHCNRVMHRDIKPDNILVCGPRNRMYPKIGNFISSKVLIVNEPQTEIGSNIYIAPEIASFCHYGFPADVFSLTVTLFEMFNGQMFRDAPKDVIRVIFSVKAGRNVKMPSCCRLPICLQSLIERGWDRNQLERPALSEYGATLKTMIETRAFQSAM